MSSGYSRTGGLHGRPFLSLAAVLLVAACSGAPAIAPATVPTAPAVDEAALLDDIQHRTFLWFWETANPKNGLVPDRWPTKSPSSIASVGFGLTAYAVGVERGWITREQARERVLITLEFFANAPQGPDPRGMTGHRGFFFHFLDMETGERFRETELSSIDTTLFLAGALFCQSYFDGDDPAELRIRNLAEQLYTAADWKYYLVRPPLLNMGWRPERGFGPGIWRGLNEGSILYILALASPAHAVDRASWDAWVSTYPWKSYYGQEHINFAPLFGHQYSHVWIDFRGIQDDYLREKGIDFFENSRRATLAQRAYAIDNPDGWRDYGENVWGLTACDGPGGGTLTVDGRERKFFGYRARGAAANEVVDDGTIAPTAAIGSIAFAPEIVIPAIVEMKRRYGDALYQKYGFIDAFNPTLRERALFVNKGTVDASAGWFDSDSIGIDQGPILLMIENYRTGLIWDVMKRNPHIVRGLQRAGFRGGWLETMK